MFLLDILHEEGYKCYRSSCIFPDQNANAKTQNEMIFKRFDVIFTRGNEKDGRFFWEYRPHDYSSMVVGGLDSRFVKDLDFDNQIIWGLHERGKPPTLITPRPNIVKEVTKKVKEWAESGWYLSNEAEELVTIGLTERDDDIMNECLNVFDHRDIYNAIVNKSELIFDLNKKEIYETPNK
jgi:hypothetical protein